MKKTLLLLSALLLAALGIAGITPGFNPLAAPATAQNVAPSAVPQLIDSLQLPPDTKLAAESYNLMVFTHVDSTCSNDLDAVTLWVYRPTTGRLLKLFTTNPKGNYECLGTGDRARKVTPPQHSYHPSGIYQPGRRQVAGRGVGQPQFVCIRCRVRPRLNDPAVALLQRRFGLYRRGKPYCGAVVHVLQRRRPLQRTFNPRLGRK